jgi:hypothetical protein
MPTNNPTNIYYTGDGSTKTYTFPFTYIEAAHVKVTVDGVAAAFTLPSANAVELAVAPAAATTVRIYRETPEDALVTWADGAVILGKHLNLSQKQSLFIAQEAHDYAEQIAEEAKQFALDGVTGTVNTALAAAVASLQAVIVPDRDAAAASATAAAASATTATTGATTATTKAGEASASATEAAALLTDFQRRYLGAKTANPTLDNEGNALVAGALYFNTTSNEMRAYDGAAWAAAYIPSGSDVASFNGRTGAVTPATGDYSVAMITGLTAALADKAAATHGHAQSDITGLDTALAAKADQTAVDTALAAKANSADMTTALAAKADQTAVDTALAAKLDASAYTAADVMTKVLANDGDASGLDADKWKGASYTVSTATPSGGADGDFWFEREV